MKPKIFIRLIFLIFMFTYPVYQLRTLYVQYKVTREGDLAEKERITRSFEGNFFKRTEEFYKDEKYEEDFKELHKNAVEE